MKILLWLDDIRDPNDSKWREKYLLDEYEIVWVKNHQELVSYIKENGLPYTIGFDHDLGDDYETGYDSAKWLVEYVMDNNLNLPQWFIQSDNPVGRKNINSYLINYLSSIQR